MASEMPHREKTPKAVRTKRTPAEKEAIYALPLSAQFHIVHIDVGSGFTVYQHLLVDTTAPDYTQILAVAKAYAAETDCWINPEVNASAKDARAKLYPGITDNANPDLRVERYGYVDVKSPQNKGKIVKNANIACKQGAIAVITDLAMDEELKHKMIIQLTDKIFSEQNKNHRGEPNYTQDEIHWFVNGQLLKYNRSEK